MCIRDSLKTANETVAKSALMDELGVSGESGSAGDAMEKLDSLAKQLVEKDTSLTSQQAFAQVLKSNPDLYNQYRNEKKGGK
jgi:fructose-1,6-bisphosphatase